jgi:hypothetical protein
MEGIAELKELDRIVQEYAAIKRERDELLEIKEDLEGELQKIEDIVDIRTRTIDKSDLEKALKQFYKYEAVQIEKVCVGSPDTATYMYPQKADPRLLLTVDILFEEREESE